MCDSSAKNFVGNLYFVLIPQIGTFSWRALWEGIFLLKQTYKLLYFKRILMSRLQKHNISKLQNQAKQNMTSEYFRWKVQIHWRMSTLIFLIGYISFLKVLNITKENYHLARICQQVSAWPNR